MDRFETRWLAAPENLRALADLSGRWIDRVRRHRSTEEIILDMDPSVSPTYGEQEQSVWNGRFGIRPPEHCALPDGPGGGNLASKISVTWGMSA